MKKFLCMLLCLATLVCMAGCGKANNEKNESNTEVTQKTVTDHLGNVVEIPEKIDRIVVCDIYPLPSVLSVFFDSAEKIVGMPMQSMAPAKSGLLGQLYPEILNAETGFIDGTDVNIEEVLKLQPDIAFYSALSPQIGEQLKNAGIPAVAISANKWNYNAIETLNNWVKLLGQIFDMNGKYEKVKSHSDKIYKLVTDRVKNIEADEREDVFFLFQYNESSILTSGKRFFGQWWAESAGANNVAQEIDKDNGAPVTMEQIYKWDPDIIFITNFTTAKPDDLYNNTIGNFDWSKIDAVEDKKVYKMPLGMYRSYNVGADTPITLLWIAKTVYPEKFSDIDITKETEKYYKEVFSIDLTKEQADLIFSPAKSSAEGFNKK